MKKINLVVVALVLLVGCSEHRQAQRSPSLPPAPGIRAASGSDLRQAGNENLRQTTAVLQLLTSTPAEALPDAVLSRAKCLVLLPAGTPDLATVACRNGNGWSAPTFAKVRGLSSTPPQASTAGHKDRAVGQSGDLLIFIMSDRGLQALLSGAFKFGSNVTVDPGPLLDERPIVTDVELKASDALGYVHNSGNLRPVKVTSGSLQLDAEMSKRVYGRGGTPQSLLQGANARSSADNSFNGMVNSFFYLIRPSGIIIHHSVLLPEPAVAEQVLDDFHSKRGFSIYCFGRVYHVAYHYLVLPDGTVKAGRPERCQGAHTRGYNSYLGIALVGDFSSDDNPKGLKGHVTPTAAQMRSLLKLCRELRQRYKIPLHRVMRHSDISTTRCPGDRFLFKEFLAQLEQAGSSGL